MEYLIKHQEALEFLKTLKDGSVIQAILRTIEKESQIYKNSLKLSFVIIATSKSDLSQIIILKWHYSKIAFIITFIIRSTKEASGFYNFVSILLNPTYFVFKNVYWEQYRIHRL